jgi:two-component system, chemotaxis family, sensor kinase CheA
MADISDKAREEFFTEAQEIVETLSRNLLALDAVLKAGSEDPALINEAFRAVHTLKGLAGLFGATRLGMLSHRLEDVLDDLRLGRMDLSGVVLDTLFEGVEVFTRILAVERKLSDDPLTVVDELVMRLDALTSKSVVGMGPSAEYDLDVGLLAVLTEYEEHRLRTNIEQGLGLYRLRVQFDLATIDRALEDIKERAKRHGEIITYLPTGESPSPDTIELDLLMASRDHLAALIGSLGADNVVIEEVPRRRRPSIPFGTVAPPPPVSKPIPPPPTGPVQQTLMSAEPPPAIPVVPTSPGPVEIVDHPPSLRSVTQTVRVDIRKLDHLMNIVGELAIVRGMFSRLSDRLRSEGHRNLSSELQRLNRSFDRRLTEMQDAILEVRMVPLGQVFDRLARVVRRMSRDVGKEIRLVITGAETEIDKLIVEELSDPLMHMIRNAIDHGIEQVDARREVGKPVAGTIALNAYQKGNHVMIEIEDDGAGIDEDGIVAKAVHVGRVGAQEAADLTRLDILNLIFVPGISTRDQVGDLSGRGVGMDVVKTNISKLGGIIDVHSESGIGTKMTITLPITLAIVNALLVHVGQHAFAIPLNVVSEAIAFDPRGVRLVDGREVMTLRGATLALCRLDRLLGIENESKTLGRRFVVVANLGARRLGLVVDLLVGQQDIVTKPLGPSLARVRGFAGATELGDQRVGLVLDTASIIEEVLTGVEPQSERIRARG